MVSRGPKRREMGCLVAGSGIRIDHAQPRGGPRGGVYVGVVLPFSLSDWYPRRRLCRNVFPLKAPIAIPRDFARYGAGEDRTPYTYVALT
jgi:hypothetical protein